MARTRTIKPEFWTDEKIGSLPLGARLLFIGLWTQADDYGVVKGNAVLLKSLIFPYDEELKASQVQEWLQSLVAVKALIPIKYNDEQYYYIRTFKKHQVINRPSSQCNIPNDILEQILQKIDDTDEFSVLTHGTLTEDSLSTHRGLTEHSLNTHGALTEDSLSTHGALTDETETETETENINPKSDDLGYVNDPKSLTPQNNPSGKKSEAPKEEKRKPLPVKATLTKLAVIWNEQKPPECPSVKEPLTDKRQKKVRVLLARYGANKLIELFEQEIIPNIRASPFLRGENQRGWVCGFDFAIHPEKFVKIMEGYYGAHSKHNAKNQATVDEFSGDPFRALDELHKR